MLVGIGYDAAHGMAKRGWRVFATARKQADVDRLGEEGGLEALRLITPTTTVSEPRWTRC